MDFGLEGRKAIVCAASLGLGKGCAMALAGEGVELVIAARRQAPLEEAAADITAKTGIKPQIVVADVTTEAGRAALLDACPEPDILVNNAGGPPAGDFRDWNRDAWIKALDANMLTPIGLIKSVIDGMIARKFGRIVNITSSSVKAPIAHLGLSNGARSGLTGFIAGLARASAQHNVTINNLLPGSFETDRLKSIVEGQSRSRGRPESEIIEDLKRANPSRRFGQPDEFGAACAFLCSMQAGYITGQNLLIDGGQYPGTF
jgi:3-oxoacyl-[acyl-carrier protein] reductase